ncbi:MAG: hypothetical protein Q8L34_05800 [Candidatus Woesearchaeota archaeon]|nr:hypothetical protein [Candidatus Woesearchaeota archaeon]
MEKQSRNPPLKKEKSVRGGRFLEKIQHEEQVTIERIKELLHLLQKKYTLTTRDLVHLLDEKDLLIPFSIFTKKLTILEAITKYLKEELHLSFHQIGNLLNRNERNIWHTYANAKKKFSTPFTDKTSRYFFPVSIFETKLSILENLVMYAKEELKLTYHQIAVLTERNDRTIWTMYQRAKRKQARL